MEVHNRSTACLLAECEVRAAQAQAQQMRHAAGGSAANVNRLNWATWLELAEPHACAISAREMASVKLDDAGACHRADHGIFTFAVSEVRTFAHAVRSCLRRCAHCARCEYISVAPSLSHCTWHRKCNRPDNVTACGFRSGYAGHDKHQLVSVALVFFGKLGGEGSKSRDLSEGDNASVTQFMHSASKWLDNLIDANEKLHFDVFMHSWSPDIEQTLEQSYGPLLIKAEHDATHYTDSTTHQLAFQCESPASVNCPRTISQMLSVHKALSLRREHEVATAQRYDLVIVSRHDMSIMLPYKLPRELLALDPLAADEIWFPSDCPHTSSCFAASSGVVPRGCHVGGRWCHTKSGDFSRSVRAGLALGVLPLGLDVMYAGSAAACDQMGNLVFSFHNLVRKVARAGEHFVHTHLLWPYHAAQSGLRVRWNLVDSRRLVFTRNEHAFARSCFDSKTEFVLQGQLRNTTLAPGMEDQCPYDHVIICPLRSATATASCDV